LVSPEQHRSVVFLFSLRGKTEFRVRDSGRGLLTHCFRFFSNVTNWWSFNIACVLSSSQWAASRRKVFSLKAPRTGKPNEESQGRTNGRQDRAMAGVRDRQRLASNFANSHKYHVVKKKNTQQQEKERKKKKRDQDGLAVNSAHFSKDRLPVKIPLSL